MFIAPVGMYIRRHLEESFNARDRKPHPDQKHGSVSEVCSKHGKTVLGAILATMGGTSAAYVISFYMPTYAIRELGLAPPVALFAAAFTGLLSFALAPFVGRWSDRVGRKPLILGSRLALALLIYPGFLWLTRSPSPLVLFVALGVLSITLTIQSVPGITMLPEMFPKHLRASGMSLVYSVGVAIFGGFSSFISAWLLSATGNKLAPAWYLLTVSPISLLGLRWMTDFTGKDIDAAGAHQGR